MATAAQLASAWSAAPLVLAGAATAALLFARAFIRLRRRGRTDHAGWSRAALFGCGLALVTLPLVSPLDAAGDEYLLSAHMLQHVLIGDAGPALLLLAVRGPLLAFMLPAAAIRFTGRHSAAHATVDRLGTPAVGARGLGGGDGGLARPGALRRRAEPTLAPRPRARELRRRRLPRLDAAHRPGRSRAALGRTGAPRSPAASSSSARSCATCCSSAPPRSTRPTPHHAHGCSG